METEVFAAPEALPGDIRALLDGADGVFSTLEWYRAVIVHALPPASRPLFLVWRAAGRAAVVPLLIGENAISGLTTPYTCLYRPCASGGMDDRDWRALGRAIGAAVRPYAHARFDALDAGSPGLAAMTAGMRGAGLVVHRFAGFGNWHQTVAGLDWPAYLAGRPGPLRETLRRKGARAGGRLRFEVVTDGFALNAGIAAYAEIYARSWKEPEPFPDFPAALMRAMAGLGALRLGLCWNGDVPIAAQIWTLERGRATIHKLAHDEAHRGESPGTLLTAAVLRPLFEGGAVSSLDFGRGDDPYKRAWVSERRQRVGILAVNPRTARGLTLLARETLGVVRRKLRSLQAEHDPGQHDPKPR